jgi:hypothetical protein
MGEMIYQLASKGVTVFTILGFASLAVGWIAILPLAARIHPAWAFFLFLAHIPAMLPFLFAHWRSVGWRIIPHAISIACFLLALFCFWLVTEPKNSLSFLDISFRVHFA